jgi:hypothetical protein
VNRRKLLLLGVSLTFASVAASAAPPSAGAKEPAQTFCQGTYALCIEAACSLIPTRNSVGKLAADHALCACDVVSGWSMGPTPCAERAETVQGTKTFLTSAFSNLYSARSRVLSCPSPSQEWAYCYGAPCVVDPNDPKKALCDCQVKTGSVKILGGHCRPEACSQLWVGATPAADEFAGPYFYEILRKEHPETAVNPPAKACP